MSNEPEHQPHEIHEMLLRVVKQLPEDYKSFGNTEREDARAPGGCWGDCSCLCRHYLVLADVGEQHLSQNWGVCINPKSHRCGLLTFEHQGCPEFEYDEERGAQLDAEHQRVREEYLKRKDI